MQLIAFDVGGTFVDLLAFDPETETVTTHKVPSRRQDLGAAVAAGVGELLAAAGTRPEEVVRAAHGTTVVTNQLVERAGARIGVLATAGFRDVLEIGRMRRPSLYDLYQEKPAPLADRDLRLELAERVTAGGDVQLAADEADARTAVAELVRRGADVIAVCLLNSYANPANEEVVGQACDELGVPRSLSSEVSPEYGEFERWSTTALNSYVMPRTAAYLEELASAFSDLGIRCPLEIMQSNGGVISADVAARFPVRLIESGPAAGVTAAAIIGARAGCENLITLDMGGTSTDVSLVAGGRPAFVSDHVVDGYPARVVGIDVRSIGAGGGSIAGVDRMGALVVGPASAGAEPGPACYDRGGSEPTVTDADLLLGFVDPDRFCGGTHRLDPGRARAAVGGLAAALGVSVDEAAVGILRVAVTKMVGAVRTITTERGHDPRDFALVAYGGAGPLHAGLVARELEIPEVLVPPDPAFLSARGLLLADHRTDAYRTFVARLGQADLAGLNQGFAELQAQGEAQVGAATAHRWFLELCYEGQQQVIPVELEALPVEREHLPRLDAELDRRFEALYGFLPDPRVAQILRLRVTVEAAAARPTATTPSYGNPGERRRPVLFPSSEWLETPVVARGGLGPGRRLPGPCIVEDDYSSIVVYPGQDAAVDELGNVRIRTAP